MIKWHQIIKLTHLNIDLCYSSDDNQIRIIFGSNIVLIWWLHRYNTMPNITEIKASNRIGKLLVSTFELSLILHNFIHYSIVIIVIIQYSCDKTNGIIQSVYNYSSLLEQTLNTWQQSSATAMKILNHKKYI